MVARSERGFAFRGSESSGADARACRSHDDISMMRRRSSADDAEDLADMFVVAREVAESEGIAESGYRLVLNVGKDAQNSIGHLHLHVIGGRPDGRLSGLQGCQGQIGITDASGGSVPGAHW